MSVITQKGEGSLDWVEWQEDMAGITSGKRYRPRETFEKRPLLPNFGVRLKI